MEHLSDAQIFEKLVASKLFYQISRDEEDFLPVTTLKIEFRALGSKRYAYPNLQACWYALQSDLQKALEDIQKLI